MPTERYWTTALCSGTALIVAGGFGDSSLSVVEVMNTETLQWSTAADLLEPLSCASATVCGDRIYIVERRDRDMVPTKLVHSCSLGDLLQSCTSSKLSMSSMWKRVADLPVIDSTCVSLYGRLLAIGGEDSDNKSTTAIRMYNSTSDSL